MSSELSRMIERHGERYRWLVTATAMVGSLSMSLSSTIINVALPHIMVDFHVGHTDAQWLSTAFLSCMTMGMLINAWCVGAFGVKYTYRGALLVFLLASAAGGIAPSFGSLIAVRAVQGLTAGLVQPLALLIIYRVFPVEQRGRSVGLYGMGVILAPTFGPVLGGVLVDLIHWRAVFLVVVPSSFVALFMGSRFLFDGREEGRRRRLDLPGVILLVGWLPTLLWALARGPHRGWDDGAVLSALAIGALAAVLFVARELTCRDPLLALSVFRRPGFKGAFGLAMLTGGGLFSSVYLLPLLMQTVLDYSPTEAGLMLMPAGLAMGLIYPVVGRLADRYSVTSMASVGLVGFCLAALALSVCAGGASFFWLAFWAVMTRVACAFLMPPVIVAALSLLREDQINQGAGVISFARQLGGAFGINLVAVVLQENSALFPFGQGAGAAQGYRDAFLLLAMLFATGVIPLYNLARGKRILAGEPVVKA
ncbi:DHA2 family efflux MFS transporter permease subunit [Alloalcanivorax mobilis]|uniref:DHA2 family efflux MFS transporter permease subunit n=1 Tax=Alloalcanivorax mobilis TaxID=2019569 RepID=UPI001300159A|nr:DHA2 family efflux MFS transporter permease subunit [Alloalcanivorax mobilis]